MSHRLSQLLGGLQSKLDAAVQSYGGGSNSQGSQQNGAQPPCGHPHSYNPPGPYGPPPPQSAPGPYGPPHGHAPPAPYAPPGDPPAYGAPYPKESPFPQAPPTAHDPPGPSDPHDSFDINLNPDTLEPYGPPPGPPPHSNSSNHYAAPYCQLHQHQHAAPSPHGRPAQAPAPYGAPNHSSPPPPAGSPNPPYGHPSQHLAPGPYSYNYGGSPAPYGAQNSYPPHAQPPHAPSDPSTFPSRVAIRSGGLPGGSTTIHDASNPNGPPLYTFRTSSSKPQVVMLHPNGRTELGRASISSMTMNLELSLRGRPMPMKQNETGNTFTVESPRGEFSWCIDQMKGCLEDMKDEHGTIVARYKGGDLPGVGERGVEVCVPCDQEMFELVMLSMMAGRALNKKNIKIGMKFLKHAIGS